MLVLQAFGARLRNTDLLTRRMATWKEKLGFLSQGDGEGGPQGRLGL